MLVFKVDKSLQCILKQIFNIKDILTTNTLTSLRRFNSGLLFRHSRKWPRKVYSEPCQIQRCFQPLTIFPKSSILDVWQDSGQNNLLNVFTVSNKNTITNLIMSFESFLFKPFMAKMTIIWKPVHWFVLQINALVSVWKGPQSLKR